MAWPASGRLQTSRAAQQMTVAVATLGLNVVLTCIPHISILATGILSASNSKCLLVQWLASCCWVIMQAAEPHSLRKG